MRRKISVSLLVPVLAAVYVQLAAALMPLSMQDRLPVNEEQRLFFTPAVGIVDPAQTIRMMVDAPADELAFIHVEFGFDHGKLSLAEEIQIATPFIPTAVTSKAEANATGQIAMTLELPGSEYGSGPRGVYELASFSLLAATGETDSTTNFPVAEPALQVTNVEAQAVFLRPKPAGLLLNPGPCGAPGADGCVDLGTPEDEAYHMLSGWGAGQEESPITPPSGDLSNRYQLLNADNGLTLTVPEVYTQYLLVTETEDGLCDDSFDILLNGQGPVYSYQADPTLFDVAITHIVSIPGLLVPLTDVTVTYRSTAEDECGFAAVYNAKLIQFESWSATDTRLLFLPSAARR